MSLRKSFSPFLLSFAVVSLVIATACGGSNQSSTPLSAAQVQAITTEMQAGFTSARQYMPGNACPAGSTSQYCFDSTVSCPSGGTIAVNGQFTMNLDVNNTGQVNSTLVLTPTNCAVRGSNLIVNGDPNLRFTSTFNVLNSEITDISATEVGTISYGPEPTGTCESNLTITATITPTQTCRIHGTACGQAVDYTCAMQN